VNFTSYAIYDGARVDLMTYDPGNS
jgi:hypothetical protein